MASGELAILKTTAKGGRIVDELHWLQSLKHMVPNIFQFDEGKNAFLMEYLQPGEPLKNLIKKGQDDKATRIICNIIKELQSDQQKNYQFKHLSELVKDLLHLKDHIDNYTLSKAQSLFQDLCNDTSGDVILHGDLHHDNILSYHSGWKVIDPHGYIGDPISEIGVMIRNPLDCFPDDKPLAIVLERRLKILAEELPFDAQKMKAWAFCMTILSAAWNVEDLGRAAKSDLEVAFTLDKIKI